MAEAREVSSAAYDPPLPRLPDDLSLQCIARVPRSSHPSLSLVSRSWHSLLRSTRLFAVRSDLAATETFLCFSLRTPTGHSLWYLFDRLRLRPLPTPPLSTSGAACAAVGYRLFLLGGSLGGVPSTAVQIFDANLNRWSLGPRMSAAREFAAAESHGGRVYVAGGCIPPSESWAETLDPGGKNRNWVTVPSPPHLREKWMHGSTILAGRLYMVADRGGVVFDPAETGDRWGPVSPTLDLGWRGRAAAVGGILYSYDFSGKLKGYNPATDEWKAVEGLEKELPKFLCGATMANLGRTLCLVWEGKGMEIEFAGIEISTTGGGQLKGSIAWSTSAILEVPHGSSIAHCTSLEI